MKKIKYIVLIIIISLFVSGCGNKQLNNSETIKKLKNTSYIIVWNSDEDKEIRKIEEEEKIEELVEIIENVDKTDDFVNLEGSDTIINFYDSNTSLIYKIKVWKDGFIGTNSKEYKIDNDDINNFYNIVYETGN